MAKGTTITITFTSEQIDAAVRDVSKRHILFSLAKENLIEQIKMMLDKRRFVLEQRGDL